VIWRSVVLVPYVVLAAVVAAAYGVQGFVTLMYFYFVAGAWLIFVLVWGSLARKAGRLNAERVWRTGRWSMGPPGSNGESGQSSRRAAGAPPPKARPAGAQADGSRTSVA